MEIINSLRKRIKLKKGIMFLFCIFKGNYATHQTFGSPVHKIYSKP